MQSGLVCAYDFCAMGNTFSGDKMLENKELLNSILKSAQMGRFGIETVMDKAVNVDLKQELQSQKDQYDAIENQAHQLARKRGWELQGLSTPLRYMSSMMGRISVMGSDTDSKIAGMLISGNAKGLIKGVKYLNRSAKCDTQIVALAQDLVNKEQLNIQKSQPFL